MTRLGDGIVTAESADEAPDPPVSPSVAVTARAPKVVRRLVVVCVGAIVLAALLYVLTVGTRTGQLVSELILGGRPASPESIVAAERVLSVLSRSTLALGTIILLVIALAQRKPRLAAVAVVTVIGANLSTQLLKNLLLDRSDLLGGQFYVLPNSFPSGHATAAASIAVALLLVLPPLLRAPTVIVSAIVVAVVAVSTLAAGWHRMADAMGGVFVAVAWAAGLAALLGWRRGVEVVGRRTATLGRWSALLPVLLGIAALVLGVIAYLLIAADPLDVLPYLAERGGSTALFWVGILITIGTCMVALGTLGFALRDARLDPRPRSMPTPGSSPGSDPSRSEAEESVELASDRGAV